MRHLLLACSLALFALTVIGCGGTRVERVDSDEIIDLSGKWNDTDSRLVAEEMIADSLSRPWIDNFSAREGRKPVVKIGRVVVRSNGDVIDTEIFTNDLRRAFINSGRVRVVMSNAEAGQIRDEQAMQDVRASEKSRKEGFQETGSDYLIVGSIKVQDDQEGRRKIKFYSVDLILTHAETGEQVWIGNKKIKKDVTESKYR
jgi:penicillin-binding protein activator